MYIKQILGGFEPTIIRILVLSFLSYRSFAELGVPLPPVSVYLLSLHRTNSIFAFGIRVTRFDKFSQIDMF
jgi:hypothetical protein